MLDALVESPIRRRREKDEALSLLRRDVEVEPSESRRAPRSLPDVVQIHQERREGLPATLGVLDVRASVRVEVRREALSRSVPDRGGRLESTDVAPGHERLRRPDVRAFARGFALKHARGTRAHLTQLRLAVFHPRASPRGGDGDDGGEGARAGGERGGPGPSAEAAESIDAAAAHNAGPRAAVVMMSPTSLVQPA